MDHIPDTKLQIVHFILAKRLRKIWVEKDTCLFFIANLAARSLSTSVAVLSGSAVLVRLRDVLGLGVFSWAMSLNEWHMMMMYHELDYKEV
jgi:hypothetical protein